MVLNPRLMTAFAPGNYNACFKHFQIENAIIAGHFRFFIRKGRLLLRVKSR